MQLEILGSLLSNPVKTKKEKKRSKQRTKHLGYAGSWMDANPIIQDDHEFPVLYAGLVMRLNQAYVQLTYYKNDGSNLGTRNEENFQKLPGFPRSMLICR